MEPIALGFTAVVITGLVFGAGPCNVACLPYLGPIFLGPVRPWSQIAAFSLGRLTGYAAMGGVAGAMGHAATRLFEGQTAAVVLGGATLLAGALLLFRRRRTSCAGARPGMARAQPALPLALFAMGLGMAFNPCVPLATVLLAAAATASPWSGAWLGFGFGIGAIVVPALLFGFLMARFGREVRAQVGRWRAPLERGAGVMLVSLGLFTLIGWMHP